MRAHILHEIDHLKYQEVPAPVPAGGEVLLEVKAVGICGSDVPRIYQTGAHVHPLIPGHEFSSIVKEVGQGVDEKWIGKAVGVFPLIPCRECLPCQRKQYEMCKSYSYLGSRRDGAFAEYVTAPVWNLIELPEGVSLEEAAMLEPMAVAVHAMRRVAPTVQDTVVVYGLGTIGLLLTMFLLEAGIKNLFVIGNKEFQKKKIMALGLSEAHYCDSRTQEVSQWIKENSKGAGADVFFECVGKNEMVSQAVDLTTAAGRICMVGNPYSDMILEKEVYWKILRNQLTVTGTWNSSFDHDAEDDWHYVLERLAHNKITPSELISHRFSLEDLECGLKIMRDKTEDYGKVMIFP